MSTDRRSPPLAAPERITVVSGLPRAGTSLLMQLLAAAGIELARDDARAPDADNPRGYSELAAVKGIRRDASFLASCRGRAVKIVAPLLPALPADQAYRVVFVERELAEVLASQRTMLQRAGHASAAEGDPDLARAFDATLVRARAWLAARPAIDTLFIDHRRLIEAPRPTVERLADFLVRTSADPARSEPEAARRARLDAMAAVIDPALHRQRR
ncbi:MAG: sulfotransferase family protein [Myxococcota bacterium]